MNIEAFVLDINLFGILLRQSSGMMDCVLVQLQSTTVTRRIFGSKPPIP